MNLTRNESDVFQCRGIHNERSSNGDSPKLISSSKALLIILHLLFRFGVDKYFSGTFRSNVNRHAFQARQIPAPDLIVIDEVSALAHWAATRASMIFQSISAHDRIEFGQKPILVIGNLQ
jgi:hypothetical protein